MKVYNDFHTEDGVVFVFVSEEREEESHERSRVRSKRVDVGESMDDLNQEVSEFLHIHSRQHCE